MIDFDAQALIDLKGNADPRTIPQQKAEDAFEEGTITDATLKDGHWSLGWKPQDGGSMGCGCPAKDDVEIKVGDTIRIYSPHGFGSTFHGIDINGEEMFWETPWERFAKRVKWLADYDRRQRESFLEEEGKLDATYDALSVPMKARIDRFREEKADFRVKSEAYEIFTCAQADVFAARAREVADACEWQEQVDEWFADGSFEKAMPGWVESYTNELDEYTPAVKWVLWWSQQPYPRQKELMPGLDGGHSGNTFGGAWAYATRLLRGQDV